MKPHSIVALLFLLTSLTGINAQNFALDFDGTNDYVSIGTISGFSSLSIEALIYPESIDGQTYPPIVKSVGEFAFEIDNNNSEIKFWVFKGTGWYASPSYTIPTLNTWYHVAGTYDANTIRLYINGTEIGTATDVSGVIGSIAYSASGVEIGRDPSNTNRLFNGKIDEVRIWNVARTQQEISDNQLIELNGNETGLVAYYDMNENTGTTLTNRSRTTSPSYNGTIDGATWVTGTDFPMMLTYVIPSANYTIGLPLYGSPMNVVVDWGDGSSTENFVNSPGEKTHTYSNAGTYTIKVTGSLLTFGNGTINTPSAGIEALTSVTSFGNLGILGLNAAFNGATGLTTVPAKLPASVTALPATFYNATNFNHDIGSWDVSKINNFGSTFQGATAFDQDLSSWDVSGAKDNNWRFQNMFLGVSLSIANYNALLISLSNQTIPSGVNFSNSSTYTGAAVEARNYLTATKGWYINGDSQTPITWNGSSTDDWNNTDNWDVNIIPISNDNVIIAVADTPPVIESGETVNCNNLTVNSGATFTINSGGSLITNGTITNNGTFTQQLTIPGNSNDWHLLSSPVAQQEISGNFTDANGYDFYLYNEPTDQWINRKNTNGGSGSAPYFDDVNGDLNFTPARGYLVAYVDPNSNAKFFTGTPNTGTQSIPITKTPGMNFSGANLLGNPYPSSIDWKAASGWTRNMLVDDDDGAGIGYTMHIWNQSANNYGTFISNGSSGTNSVTQFIPPMQGFFVMAESAGTLQMTNDVRVHDGAEGWMKQQETNPSVLKMRLAHPEFGSDEAILEFSDIHNGGAPKWLSMEPTAPSLWIKEEDKDFAIRFTATDRSAPLALHFQAGVQGAYTFSIDKAELNFNHLILEDLLLGTTHNLLEENHYAFSADPSQSSHRFNLRFDLVGMDEKPEFDNLMIWQQGELLHLIGTDGFTDLQLFDVHGKLLMHKKLYADSQQQIAAPKTAGVYVVRLFNARQMITKKVVIY